jgi:hypothetical protein
MSNKLPTCRDQNGQWVQYPGQIVYIHDNWRLVYIGTLDGRHEFFAEQVSRRNLGEISFDAAKEALLGLIEYEKDQLL